MKPVGDYLGWNLLDPKNGDIQGYPIFKKNQYLEIPKNGYQMILVVPMWSKKIMWSIRKSNALKLPRKMTGDGCEKNYKNRQNADFKGYFGDGLYKVGPPR